MPSRVVILSNWIVKVHIVTLSVNFYLFDFTTIAITRILNYFYWKKKKKIFTPTFYFLVLPYTFYKNACIIGSFIYPLISRIGLTHIKLTLRTAGCMLPTVWYSLPASLTTDGGLRLQAVHSLHTHTDAYMNAP